MHVIFLSIVIPTKNRYEYLKILLSTLLNFNSQNFEIVIQDNTTQNSEILSFLDKYTDKRIVYRHNAHWMSMSENCDKGISSAQGKYILMLGDDDGVVEAVVGLAEWMYNHNIDATLTNKPIYLWPGIKTRILGYENSGSLLLKRSTGKILKIDPLLELNKVLKLGGTEIRLLPRVYHGLVSKDCLDKMKEETGTYFPGPSPDMANAIGLTKYVKNFYLFDREIIITGNAPKSAGGKGLRNEHFGRIEDQNSLPVDTADKWSLFVPKFWSGQTIWAESVHKALEATNRENLVLKFNYSYLFVCCLVYQKHFNHITVKTIFNYKALTNQSLIKFNFKIFFNIFSIYFFRISSLYKNIKFRLLPSSNYISGLKSIKEAIDFIELNFKINPKFNHENK